MKTLRGMMKNLPSKTARVTDSQKVLWRWSITLISILAIWTGVAVVRGFIPFGDFGLAALAIGDVFTVHTPTVGMPSTAWGTLPGSDLRHPGPLHFQLLAPVYLLTGRSAWGLLLSGFMISSMLLVITLVLAHRIAGSFGVRLVGFGSLWCFLGGATMVTPWNPVAAILGTGLVLVSSWGVLSRQRGMWPWLVFSLSLVVQSHLGVIGVMAVVALFVVGSAARSVRAFGNPWSGREILLALAVGFASWAAPVWGIVSAQRTNVTELFDWLAAVSQNDGSGIPLTSDDIRFTLKVVLVALVVLWTRVTLKKYDGETSVRLKILMSVYAAALVGVVITLVVSGLEPARFLNYANPIFLFPIVTAGFVFGMKRGVLSKDVRAPAVLVALVVGVQLVPGMVNYPDSWLKAASYAEHVRLAVEQVAEIEGVPHRPVVVSYPNDRWNQVAPAIAAELAANGFDARIPNREEPIRPDPLWWRETPVDGPHLVVRVRTGSDIGSPATSTENRRLRWVGTHFSGEIQGSPEGFDLVIIEVLE